MMNEELSEMETDEVKLLDVPDEILLQIFSNLNDQSLLHAVLVCKRFETIAKETVAKKYNGASDERFYTMKISGENLNEEWDQNKPLFATFGDHIKAINIEFIEKPMAKNHWIMALIKFYGKSLAKVTIQKGKKVDLFGIIRWTPNLTHLCLESVELLNDKWAFYSYPKLKHFSANSVNGNERAFVFFVVQNRQLEDISLIYFIDDPLNVLNIVNGKLNNLKNLELSGRREYFTDFSKVSIMTLKTLTVSITESSFHPLLRSIGKGFKFIEELSMESYGYNLEIQTEDIKMLCSLQMLKTLKLMHSYTISYDFLKEIIDSLPNLVSFSFGDADNLCKTFDDLFDLISVCLKLSHLKLIVNLTEFPKLNYGFYSRFHDLMEINGKNLMLELEDHTLPKKMVITKEQVHCIKDFDEDELEGPIIYWMGYETATSWSNENLFQMDEEILKKIFAFLDGNSLLALYQTSVKIRPLVIKHIKQTVFRCAVTPRECLADNALETFGQYIYRIFMDFCHFSYDVNDDEDTLHSPSHQLKTGLLKSVNESCQNLVEMEIKDYIQIETTLYWPNLKKLKFRSHTHMRKLKHFNCPQLTHLHVGGFKKQHIDFDWSNCFPNLTSLRFCNYSKRMETFLWRLNQTICNQMKELSLKGKIKENKHRSYAKLINTIARFGRLTGLHLYIEGIEKANYKFLFESCPMLVELSMYCAKEPDVELFQSIHANCKQLKFIQLFSKSPSFARSSLLQYIYSMMPKVKFSLINRAPVW